MAKGKGDISTMRGLSPEIHKLIGERAKVMIEEEFSKEEFNIFYTAEVDEDGGVVDYVPTLQAIDEKGKVINEDNNNPIKTVTKKYNLIGGGTKTVEYLCYKDTLTDKEVRRPKSWSEGHATYIQEMRDTMQLVSDVMPVEAMFRCSMDIPSLTPDLKQYVGEDALKTFFGLKGDGKNKPEHLEGLAKFSRCQQNAFFRNFVVLYDEMAKAIAVGGSGLASVSVDTDIIVDAKLAVAPSEDTEYREVRREKDSDRRVRKASTSGSLSFSVSDNGDDDKEFKFSRK